jgi:murein DD-endopeptidase MepM/ murein hydrolase activator NlpD
MEGTTMKRTTGIILFIVIWALTLFAQQQDADRFTKVVNRLIEAMKKQDYAGIVREYDSALSTSFPLNNTTILFKNYESQYGNVVRTDPPQVKAIDQAVCTIYFERGTQDLTLYINDQDKVKGFIFTTHVVTETKPIQEPKPESVPTPSNQTIESKPVQTQTTPAPSSATSTPAQSTIIRQPVVPVIPDKQQTELYPPFKGNWIVITGGELRDGVSQSDLLRQQYTYEFSATNTDGSRYKNDGKTNEDYFGYGKEVLSPANGTVIEVIDGIRDNSSGIRNPYAPIGNTIIIQHSNREYSVLSFLKQGSIRVRVGEKVTRGQVIASCGVSGNATEPLIHYHLQDSPYLQTAKGIKFYFERAMVVKEGKKELKLNYLPEINETINLE